jgi:NAD(P)-dependent dehydrogenase (short-subunit alcohol dehydrogenase family)
MSDAKTIFITGAASGIGRASALRFAKGGWFVGLSDIDETGLARVADEIAGLAGEGRSFVAPLDVTDRGGWDEALSAFVDAGGDRLDALFNNAGIGAGGNFEEMDEALADKVVDINLQAVIDGIYAALPYLEKTPDSMILNNASATAVYGFPSIAVYSATKFGVRGLTESLDLEFEPKNIRVKSLMPWFIDTAILDAARASAVDGPDDGMTGRQRLEKSGIRVYPVDIAADTVWQAVHDRSKQVHWLVGEDTKRYRFLARHLPGFLRKRMMKQQADRLKAEAENRTTVSSPV